MYCTVLTKKEENNDDGRTQQRHQIRNNHLVVLLPDGRHQQPHMHQVIAIVMLGRERLEAVMHGIFDGTALGGDWELGVGDVEAVVVAWAVGGMVVLEQVRNVVQPDAAVP